MQNKSAFPLALDAPQEAVVALDAALTAKVVDASRRSPRGRIIQPIHRTQDDALHRMLNVVQPHSYVQPHRHLAPPKPESFVVLAGAIRFVAFDDAGGITECITARAGGDVFGIDVEAGVFHTFYALEADTVIFEVKPGPYVATSDKDFAAWAPREGDAGCTAYMEDLICRTRSEE